MSIVMLVAKGDRLSPRLIHVATTEAIDGNRQAAIRFGAVGS